MHAALLSFCAFLSPLLLLSSLFFPLLSLFYISISFILSALRRLEHSFSLLPRSIARRGRGDAATPCPSIPLTTCRQGVSTLIKIILWSHCQTAVTVARRCSWLATATIRLYVVLIIPGGSRELRTTRDTLSKPLDINFKHVVRTLLNTPKHFDLFRNLFFSSQFSSWLEFTNAAPFLSLSRAFVLRGDITWAPIDNMNINGQLAVFFFFISTGMCRSG